MSSLSLNEKVVKSVERSVKEMLKEAVTTLGEKYSFDANEALEILNIGKMSMVAQKKEKQEKKKVLPLPFIEINKLCCYGLIPNHGLYTQCPKSPIEGGLYCNKCNTEALKNEKGEPTNGDVRKRLEPDFVPPNKNKVVPYVKIMKNLNLTREQVEEEATNQGIVLPESIFEEVLPKEKVSRRGRPKKQDIEVVLNETDQFVRDVLEQEVKSLDELMDNETVSNLTEESSEKKVRPKLTKEEREAKKQEREAKKQAREAKKQEKPLPVVESVQVAPEPVVEQVAEPVVEKVVEPVVEQVVEPVVEQVVEPVVEQVAVESEAEDLKKMKFNGNYYFKGVNSGLIYDFELTKSRNIEGKEPIVIGKWNKDTKSIDFYPKEDSEEEEDEYSSDEE